MTIKHVLNPERIRRIPAQFSWVDHRLVQEQYLQRCDPHAAALYLFLVTVADARGLSYYSDVILARCLSMAQDRMRLARDDLIRLGLIAYKHPLYQVLSLDMPPHQEVLKLGADEIRARIDQLHSTLGRAP